MVNRKEQQYNLTETKMTQFKPTPLLNYCSRNFINFVICIFLIYVVLDVGKACKFSNLNTDSIWIATHNDNSTVHAIFRGSIMIITRCDSEGTCFQDTRKCLSRKRNNKYEVQHASGKEKTPPKFLCIQILRRGTSIIQIKESRELYFRSRNSCNDQHLRLDNWPMVAIDKFMDQNVPCPFSGGYDIRIHISTSDKEPGCDREMIPARLESECEQENIMTFHFRRKECQEKFMEIVSFYCAAMWTQEKYTFVILRPKSDELKVWCMRVTGTDFNKPIENGHLFFDLVCDPGDGKGIIRETKDYFHLEFTQRTINSTCADSFPRICYNYQLCQYKYEIYSVFCRRFCNYCSTQQKQCKFPQYLQGGWIGNRHGEQMGVNISYFDIYIGGLGQFQCHGADGNEFENRTIILQTYSNGCYPRYACFEGKKVSPSILEYRLGNRVSWPVKNWDSVKEDVCADQQFKPSARDKEKFGSKIDEKPTTILVDPEHQFSVNCNLQAWSGLTDNMLYMKESKVCEYCFFYDANNNLSQHNFIAQPFNCTSGISLDHKVYHCLGVFPYGDNIHAVVTSTIHARQEYLCWVFIHTENNDDKMGIVYVLDATDCNRVAIKAVHEGTLVPKRTLVILKNHQNCQYIEPNLSTTTKPDVHPDHKIYNTKNSATDTKCFIKTISLLMYTLLFIRL